DVDESRYGTFKVIPRDSSSSLRSGRNDVSFVMPFHYLEDVGTADIAFEATGRDLPELFTAAADATMNVMIDNLDAIESREARQIELSDDKIDMLLFDFLQELIYFKDARRLLLRARETQIDHKSEGYFLRA